MKAAATRTLLKTLREVDLGNARTTFKDVRAASKALGTFDKGEATVTRMRGLSPWERHAKGDELFYVISGGLSFRLLTKRGERAVDVPAGGVFIVPRGVWHRSQSRRGTAVLVVRGSEHGPVTFAADPRHVPKRELVG